MADAAEPSRVNQRELIAPQYSQAYETLVTNIIRRGKKKPSRQVGSATRSLLAQQLRAPIACAEFVDGGASDDMRARIPMLRCKKLALITAMKELAWFLRGSTNAAELSAQGCHIWDDDAAKAPSRGFDLPPGELGPIYGYQWRKRPTGDQITRAIDTLARDPFGRRNLVVTWAVDDIPNMVLPPCHFAFQLVCALTARSGAGHSPPDVLEVSCAVTMRSTDVGLGLPFNVASYAILLALMCNDATWRSAELAGAGAIAETRKYLPGEVVITMNDCHIYEDHIEPLREAVVNAKCAAEPVATLQIPGSMTVDDFAKLPAHEFKRLVDVTYAGERPPTVSLPLHT